MPSILSTLCHFVCGFGRVVRGPIYRKWRESGDGHVILDAVQRQHFGNFERVVYGGWLEISTVWHTSHDGQNHVLIDAYSRFGWRYRSLHFYGFNADGTAQTGALVAPEDALSLVICLCLRWLVQLHVL
ncbi:hypothetical protein BDZ89DRAFT_1046838 [Hymenopellis radicata]|nr:hypothetical protein BDZ89DRAFT_1046838 [Hymenopellis radicata]